MKMKRVVLALLVASTSACASEDWQALAARCAPDVDPATMLSIIIQESGGNPYRIGINASSNAPAQSLTFDSAGAATAAATVAIAKGRSVDMGLTQFNSANLGLFGYRVEDLFDPCTAITAGARVLKEGYDIERKKLLSSGTPDEGGQRALAGGLSRYNTGSATSGLANGYVASVKGIASGPERVPAIRPWMPAGDPSATSTRTHALADNTPTPAAAYAAAVESDIDIPFGTGEQPVPVLASGEHVVPADGADKPVTDSVAVNPSIKESTDDE